LFLRMCLISWSFLNEAIVIYNGLIVLLRIVRIVLWICSIQYLRYLVALQCVVLLMSAYILIWNILSWVYLGAIHHVWDVMSLITLLVVLLERFLPLFIILLIVVILVCGLIFPCNLLVAHFVLIIFVLLWDLLIIFVNIFLFHNLVNVLDLRLHNAHLVNVNILAYIFIEAWMIFLINLVWWLPLLILFMHTVLERLAIYNHWALQLLFLNFLLLLFIKSIKVYWFVYASVITVLKVRHVHLFRDKFRLVAPWILSLWLHLIVCFLSFNFNIIVISRIIRHRMNGSLLRIINIWYRLHLRLILNSLNFFGRCDRNRCSFYMGWNRFLLLGLANKLVFVINLMILLAGFLLRIILHAVYLFKVFYIFIINYDSFVDLINFYGVLLLFLN